PLSGSAQARLRMPTLSAIQKWRPWNPFSRRLGGEFLRFRCLRIGEKSLLPTAAPTEDRASPFL
ncbi:MAG TPA: hypothetical protein PKK30_12390, partial [Nitrospira sp.]|nr:hypothetical protein [Nitrospira sp.]